MVKDRGMYMPIWGSFPLPLTVCHNYVGHDCLVVIVGVNLLPGIACNWHVDRVSIRVFTLTRGYYFQTTEARI